VCYGEEVTAIEPEDEGFAVRTDKSVHRAKTVMLALGRRGTPRKLGVPGDEHPKVIYTLIDPAEYQNKNVLVVGGGDSALEAAMACAEAGATNVALSYRSESFSRAKVKNREKIDAAAQSGGVQVLLKTTVAEITPEEAVIQSGDDTIRLDNDVVIVCAGGILPTGFLKDAGVLVETKYGAE
jgi:thioredoxin reductase